MKPPAIELTESLQNLPPGRALDLACGSGRHAIWLRDRGWAVTAVDLSIQPIDGITGIQADLEHAGFIVEPDTWDLIVCWLYWQQDLSPFIARGVHRGGTIALAGKVSGRFATSLERYRLAFPGWNEISAGQNDHSAYFIAVRP